MQAAGGLMPWLLETFYGWKIDGGNSLFKMYSEDQGYVYDNSNTYAFCPKQIRYSYGKQLHIMGSDVHVRIWAAPDSTGDTPSCCCCRLVICCEPTQHERPSIVCIAQACFCQISANPSCRRHTPLYATPTPCAVVQLPCSVATQQLLWPLKEAGSMMPGTTSRWSSKV